MTSWATAAAAIAWIGSSSAAPRKPAASTGSSAARADVSRIAERVAQADASKLPTVLDEVQTAGLRGAAPVASAIAGRLQGGLPTEVVQQALRALGSLGHASSFETCNTFLKHRDVGVRAGAVACISGSRAPEAGRTLLRALHDPEAKVRDLAATLVGVNADASAVPDLLAAFDKGVDGAAVSIGQLCTAESGRVTSCDVLLGRLKSRPLDVVGSGIERILLRTDLPDEPKRRALAAVRELSSAKARELLAQVRKEWPQNGSKAIAEALDQAIRELEGAR